MSYFFHPAAETEYLESIAYFESKRPGLGAAYLAEFERVLPAQGLESVLTIAYGTRQDLTPHSAIYTIAANLAGLPGMSIPVAQVGGLPVGLQIVGNYFEEGRLLNVAHRLQAATNWHLAAPGGFE